MNIGAWRATVHGVAELHIHMPVYHGMRRPGKFSHVTILNLYQDKFPTT